MLELSRKVGEEIIIGGNIVVKVLRIKRASLTLGIEAPKDIKIFRSELLKNTSQQPPATDNQSDK